MNRNKKPKAIAARLLAVAFSLILGVLVTAQWRSIPTRVTNPIAPYVSLKETRSFLYDDQNELKNEIKELQHSIEKIQKESENISLTKEELDSLNIKKAQAGLTKLNGSGVIIIYDDSRAATLSEDSIIHAADLRDTVNSLWGAGAEAISINGQRVVVNTAIDCIVNTILVNNTKISNPFQIEAIGDQDLIYSKLINSNALSNIYRRKSEQGLIFEIRKNNDITVPVFDGSFEVKAGVSS